jgi:hypothetical protein
MFSEWGDNGCSFCVRHGKAGRDHLVEAGRLYHNPGSSSHSPHNTREHISIRFTGLWRINDICVYHMAWHLPSNNSCCSCLCFCLEVRLAHPFPSGTAWRGCQMISPHLSRTIMLLLDFVS